jgi:predicted TIM-barrel fold metal-dependent hydrolase
MFPCPLGKVPYSLQQCFLNGKDWPPIEWVEQQIKNKKIDFLGEVLSQYYGISSSDSSLYPYYRLAEKYSIPVGIHTGAAGPNHGSPNFKLELGDPLLLKKMLADFPNLKVWIMHAGDRHYKETIQMMKDDPRLYTDISVISNPEIVPPELFAAALKDFIDAGLEDRLMFGSDNGDINKTINNIATLTTLTTKQKEKIFYLNAEQFFLAK